MYSSPPQQPPQSSSPPPRILHIYLDNGITHRNMTVRDSDKTTPLYTIHSNSGSMFSSKPHMRITRTHPAPATEIGSATFHQFSSTTDLQIHGRALTLASPSMFTRSRFFQSAAAGVGKLTWQHESTFSSALTLRNERNEWLARFDRSTFSLEKHGKLELVGGDGVIGGQLLDEIVISGLAIVQGERRAEAASAGG